MTANLNVKAADPAVKAVDYLAAADEAGNLWEEIREKNERLSELKASLAAAAAYKPGSATGHLAGSRWAVTVVLKKNETWDQKQLESLRKRMGEEKFRMVFRYKWDKKSQKDLDSARDYSPYWADIDACRTVKDGAPSVSFKRMEDC